MATEKIFQVVIFDDEAKKLRELADAEERSMSWIVRKLINREHAQLFQTQIISPNKTIEIEYPQKGE